MLARLESDVTSLRRRGFGEDADRMAVVAREFRAALEPIALVPEHDALARSGKPRAWLRGRFEEWQRVGAAAIVDGVRHYRLCVLPHQLDRALGVSDAERSMQVMR